MRRILLVLALLVPAVMPGTAGALTRDQVFGIGDLQHAGTMLGSQRLLKLQPGSTRMLADWDVARSGGWGRDRVDAWYRAALEAGVEPLLSFQGYERKRVPSVRAYTRAVKAAMARWPEIREWQVWNEANHDSQPAVYDRPRLAARYAKAFERVRCSLCTVVPITIVVSNSDRTTRWLKRWLDEYGRTPRIWALHNYGDVNRFTNVRMAQFLRDHPRGRVWITETGGFAKFDDQWKYSLRRQGRAARFAFRQALRFRKRVDRMYWWEWRGEQRPRRAHWDTGLINWNGSARPAYRAALRERFRAR